MGLIKDFIPTSVQRGVKLTIVHLQIISGHHGHLLRLSTVHLDGPFLTIQCNSSNESSMNLSINSKKTVIVERTEKAA